jgi:hypothetical protein
VVYLKEVMYEKMCEHCAGYHRSRIGCMSSNVCCSMDAHGLPSQTPHLLRHSAGTFWIKSGGSSAILQKILGHTTQSTTQLYIHLAGSDVKEWHSRFSPGDRMG